MPGSPKKKTAKPRAKATHPKTIAMVVEAIKAVKDAKGTSLQGVRNYIKSHYPTANTSLLNSQLRRAVKTGLASGVLVRPKGDTSIGATGRFRVGKPPAAKPKKKTPKKKPAKKAKKAKKPKAKTPKKKAAAKKAKKPKSPKKKKAAKPKKSPKKAKKPAAKKAKKPAKKAGAKKSKAKAKK